MTRPINQTVRARVSQAETDPYVCGLHTAPLLVTAVTAGWLVLAWRAVRSWSR